MRLLFKDAVSEVPVTKPWLYVKLYWSVLVVNEDNPPENSVLACGALARSN